MPRSGLFQYSVDHLLGETDTTLMTVCGQKDDVVVVTRPQKCYAQKFCRQAGHPLAIIDKRRLTNVAEVMNIISGSKDKNNSGG